MIHGDIEETLELPGVQVHRHDAIDPCRAQEVRDQLRAETVRIALSAVEQSRLTLYRGRLRDGD
jgi:hypothetical protein